MYNINYYASVRRDVCKAFSRTTFSSGELREKRVFSPIMEDLYASCRGQEREVARGYRSEKCFNVM
jgi:hypothetical protein